MKVILLRDVSNVGKKDEVRDIADGYVRNFLLPRKLAIVATPEAIAALQTRQMRTQELRAMRDTLLERNLKDLGNAMIEIVSRTNKQGHLFAGVGAEEIAAAVKRATDIELDPRDIILDHPIKTTGEYAVPLAVSGKKGTIRCRVTSA